MLPRATYCHWNLHITHCEKYKKKMSKNVLQIVVKLNMFKQISRKCGQYCPHLNKIVHIFWVHSILKFNNLGHWIKAVIPS
jgi:hypothetical protein